MEIVDVDKKIKFYKSSNERHKISRDIWGLYLKNDYSNKEYLMKLKELCNLIQGINPYFSYSKVHESFSDDLIKILKMMNDDRIISFFQNAINGSSIDYCDDLYVGETKALLVNEKESSNSKLHILFPTTNLNTNISYSALIHELVHYSLVKPHVKEAMEYSEVLSMFFEYLMYMNTSDAGDQYFYNNRLVSLCNDKTCFNEDLNFALDEDILGISPEYYEGALSSSATYYDSLEYALQLIERNGEDKKLVMDSIGKILQGESSCDIESKKLDIDTSSYKELKKIITNHKC